MMNFRNRRGFSLLEIIIAMGLATGLLIFIMKMQTEQAKNAKTAIVNKEVETFFNDFRAVVDRAGYCNKSFENVTFTDNSRQTIDTIKNPRGDVRYAVGETYGSNTVKLNAITLRDFKPDDKDGFEGIATLEVSLERIGKIYGGKNVTKTMEVSVSRDKVHKIISCGPLSSSGGGINIVIAPGAGTSAATTTTPPSTTTQSTTPTSTTTSVTSTGLTKGPASQEVLMKELQEDPQMKEMQDEFKQMQKQNQKIDDVIDDN
ncbi:MAG: type II secretion system protein [Bacteriovorax sp.]|nr:type II secretion system protein [Bacteriovorax sp.]